MNIRGSTSLFCGLEDFANSPVTREGEVGFVPESFAWRAGHARSELLNSEQLRGFKK